jgi:hypothetical protein
MKKSELKAYRERWAEVDKVELELLRHASLEQKLMQFLSLMASAHLFRSHAKKAAELMMARERWQQLRKKMRHAK